MGLMGAQGQGSKPGQDKPFQKSSTVGATRKFQIADREIELGQYVHTRPVDKSGNCVNCPGSVDAYVIEVSRVSETSAGSGFASIRVNSANAVQIKALHAYAIGLLEEGETTDKTIEELAGAAQGMGLESAAETAAVAQKAAAAAIRDRSKQKVLLVIQGEGKLRELWERDDRGGRCRLSYDSRGKVWQVREDGNWDRVEQRVFAAKTIARGAKRFAAKEGIEPKVTIVIQGSKTSGEEEDNFVASLLHLTEELQQPELIGENVSIVSFAIRAGSGVLSNPLLVDWKRRNHCGFNADCGGKNAVSAAA